MEQTYLYYPAKKAHKILLASKLEKKGFKSVFFDSDELSIIYRKNSLFAGKKFFEVMIRPTSQNGISCVSVSQIYTDKIVPSYERYLVETILKIF